MTRLPVRPAIPPEQALLFVGNIYDRFAVVARHAEEYFHTIRGLAEQGLGRSLVYEALIVRCARKAKADALFTWDVADFQRMAPELADRIRTPRREGSACARGDADDEDRVALSTPAAW